MILPPSSFGIGDAPGIPALRKIRPLCRKKPSHAIRNRQHRRNQKIAAGTYPRLGIQRKKETR